MNHNSTERLKKNIFTLLVILLSLGLNAQTTIPLRRPISPQQPMWLIHIDTWNYADPQKIIDLIPVDIRPYVVMNISLSVSHNEATSRYQIAEYGYEIAKSWLRVCAENQMWAVVQPSSGGFSQFSDFDLSVYEEFFSKYPNFLGFNYAEQFWGFDNPADPLAAKWNDRMAHFANLLKVCNKHGGYLIVSWCGNQWSPSINPIAMLKRNPNFASACRNYTENYILCEKYTQTSYISDMESICLGSYLSGFSGQYGIRYDDTGWTGSDGTHAGFTMATGLAPHLEHIMMTGETVVDGPELIWTQCFKEVAESITADGFSRRNWQTFSQFDNVNVDLFRKIIDGTVRIPSRKEVIDRTKVVIVNDVNTSDVNATYSSPQTLFEGLYQMDGDGNYENNKSFFKKSGRYPTIPTVYQLDDADANSFLLKINRSNYSTHWPSIASKKTELDGLFPKEYSGDLYVGRMENGIVAYNPYKTERVATASIPLKYNTCDSLKLKLGMYSAGVVKEYADNMTFYLNNYDNVLNTSLKNDTIQIFGCVNEPTFTTINRGNSTSSIVSKLWNSNIFTLIVKHNGPLDINVMCSGAASGRISAYTPSTLIQPKKPALYTGTRQYEFECSDYKSISSLVKGGQNGSIRNYTGQGYIIFGTSVNAALRDTVNVIRKGEYNLEIRYYATAGNVTTIDLFVNGEKVSTPIFQKTTGTWAIVSQNVNLNAGANSVVLKSRIAGAYNILFDNFTVSQGVGDRIYTFVSDLATNSASSPAAQFVNAKSGTAGVVEYVDGNGVRSNCLKAYSVGGVNNTGVADLELFQSNSVDHYVVWKEHYGNMGSKKGILLRGTDMNGNCPYAIGLKQGYLFSSTVNNGSIKLEIAKATLDGLESKTSFTAPFSVSTNNPCWYRASANANCFEFECSLDSLHWFGASSTRFVDNSYTSGSSQLVWGQGSVDCDWTMDNIMCASSNIMVSKPKIEGLGYTFGESSIADFIQVEASYLKDNLLLNVTGDFEISQSKTEGFSNSILISQNKGNVTPTIIYVRAKAGLSVNSYVGTVELSSNGVASQSVVLSALIAPVSVKRIYSFSSDIASLVPQTPPAQNCQIGLANSATAGVISYTDSRSKTSNVLKPYSCGSRNLTGVVNLNLFSSQASDYSVTWKQCISSGSEYKVGMLLRGDNANVGTASIGYEAGLKSGYLFIVNNKTSGGAEFRIYKASSSTQLNRVSIVSITTLTPSSNQPVWYRASALGSNPVSLKIEYSSDSVSWSVGATYTDTTSPYTSGSTQLVWGLGVNSVSFYLDNIMFNGIEISPSATNKDIVYDENVSILSREYYTITGLKVTSHSNKLKGIYIIQDKLSNGQVKSTKVMIHN